MSADDDEFLREMLANGPNLAPSSPARPDSVWLIVDGSSNVAEIIYWYDHGGPAGANLGIRFDNHREKRGQREYHYWDVPESVYSAIVQALSRGETFWSLVRRRNYLYREWRADLGYHVGGERYS